MPIYLTMVKYSNEAISNLVAYPQDRQQIINSAVEKFGGNIKAFWFSLGEYDVIVISEMADNVSALAFEMSVKSRGAVSRIVTIPLLSIEDSLKAMKMAQKSEYKPPGIYDGDIVR
jgi:uncharacterized protein with GYD domain